MVHIYEINTWVWLNSLSVKYQKSITLATVPAEEIKAIADLHIDVVWLMGVWERSPAGRRVALNHAGLQREYREALPDFKPDDVIGSPYCVRRYMVDNHLGGNNGLAKFREHLKAHRIKLILDFVPNHVAIDHPWTQNQPENLIQGTSADLKDDPDSFFQVGTHVFAFGRDPYFPSWTDTAQVNAFSPSYRQASIDILLEIAKQCDGVRCDMAMLLVNRVFSQTWSEKRVGEAPSKEYWDVITPAIKKSHREFLFIAEVYWDMEFELQQQGFNYCYDKRLYDRMVNENALGIHQHLIADRLYQNKLIRFIENHDERRALRSLGERRSQMAAILVATLPGAKLWHEGQFEGYRTKLPVQLGRRMVESTETWLQRFYRELLKQVDRDIYRHGEWVLRDLVPAWPNNWSCRNMIAYTWQHEGERCLIVINYSDHRSQARVHLNNMGLEGKNWKLTDLLDNSVYERIGERMVDDGLYIELMSWQAHIFELEPVIS